MNSAAHFVGAASIELAFALLCLSAVKIYKDAQIHCLVETQTTVVINF